MKILKTKYIIIFGVAIIVAVLYLMSYAQLISPVFGAGDITIIMIFLILILLFLIGNSIEVSIKGVQDLRNDVNFTGPPEKTEEMPVLKGVGNLQICRYIVGLQRYFKNASNKEELLNRLLVASSRITHSERASIMLYDKKNDELYVYKTLGWKAHEIRMTRNMRSKPGEGIAGRVFLDGKPRFSAKFEDYEELEQKDKYRSESFISLPIFSEGEIIGVLNLTEKEDGEYSKIEQELLLFMINEVDTELQKFQSKKASKTAF